MRVVFIGCVEFSKFLLEEILDSKTIDVAGVVTKEKSKINSDFYDLSEVAQKHGVESYFFDVKKPEDEMVNWIQQRKPDVIFCFGWSHLISIKLINMPRFGIVGYHPAELPMNRGRHPIIWALVLGLKQTGSTFFMINEDADSGDIVSQKVVSIEEEDDANSLYWKLNEVAKKQIRSICEDLAQGRLSRTVQNHNKANVWRKRGEKDGLIDWRMSTASLYNLIRGLAKPYPGAYFQTGEFKVTVWKSRKVHLESPNIEPGKILECRASSFIVKTADGALEILEYQGDFNPSVGEYV